MACKVQIRLASPLCLLLEAMQHIDSILEFRHVQHSECSRGIANPDFPHPCTNTVHGFPIIRLTSALDLIELKSSRTACGLRKRAQIFECAISELDWLKAPPLNPAIHNFVYLVKAYLQKAPVLSRRTGAFVCVQIIL